MKKLWQVTPFLLTILVLYKTYPLKLISYDKIPSPGITFDEYAFAWMGKSFLQSGMPVSWTTNPGLYKKSQQDVVISKWGLKVNGIEPTWQNLFQIQKPAVISTTFNYGLGDRHIDLVQPYLDHPPLAGIIYSLGIPKNRTSLTDVKPADFRNINAVLGVATASLVFILGATLYSPWTGFLASLIYSTMPSTLFSSRLTLAENVTIPFFLISMIYLLWSIRKRNLYYLIFSGFLAGACFLTKFSGISAALAGTIILFESKAVRKHYVTFILAFLIPVLSYFTYANILSPSLFWEVMTSQSSRGNWGIINLIQSVSRINFSGFPIDGWWAGGIVTLFYLIRDKKHVYLGIMSLSFLLITTILGGDYYAWYFFPLGVFVCLAWGILIKEIVEAPNFSNNILFFLFAILSSFYWGHLRQNPQTNFSWIIRIAAIAFVGSGLIVPKLFSKISVTKYLWVILMVLVIHRLYLWNIRGFQYILSQWGKLPPPLMLP